LKRSVKAQLVQLGLERAAKFAELGEVAKKRDEIVEGEGRE
jgi:hypothetical protein